MMLLLTLQVHIAQCQPVRRFWEVQTRPKGCIDIGLWVMITSYLNTLTDILLFLLPVPLVYKLQMHINQKLAIAVMFLAGLIPVVASIVRNVHLMQSYMDQGNWITRDTSWCVFPLINTNEQPPILVLNSHQRYLPTRNQSTILPIYLIANLRTHAGAGP